MRVKPEFSLEIGPKKVQNDKCYRDSWHLLKIVQGSYPKSLVKIGSVTAKILLIWTNVPVTVGICCR